MFVATPTSLAYTELDESMSCWDRCCRRVVRSAIYSYNHLLLLIIISALIAHFGSSIGESHSCPLRFTHAAFAQDEGGVTNRSIDYSYTVSITHGISCERPGRNRSSVC